ncbi:MAG: hypothetical protein QXM12_01750 [Nitrososphaerota archaeon]
MEQKMEQKREHLNKLKGALQELLGKVGDVEELSKAIYAIDKIIGELDGIEEVSVGRYLAELYTDLYVVTINITPEMTVNEIHERMKQKILNEIDNIIKNALRSIINVLLDYKALANEVARLREELEELEKRLYDC